MITITFKKHTKHVCFIERTINHLLKADYTHHVFILIPPDQIIGRLKKIQLRNDLSRQSPRHYVREPPEMWYLSAPVSIQPLLWRPKSKHGPY